MAVWHDVVELAEGQHGAFVTSQARDLGGDDGWLARAQRDGLIARLRRGAYGVIGLLDEWTQMAAIQLLDVHSVAARRAAAHLNGLPGTDRPPPMDVLVPRSHNLRGPLVHHCHDLVDDDVVVIDGLRCTDAVRTLCDLGAVVEPRELQDAVEAFLEREPSKESLLFERAEALARRGRSGPGQLLTALEVRRFAASLRTAR